MHKQDYVPTTFTIKTIQKMIEAKFESRDERIDFFLSQASRINKKSFLHKAMESITPPPEYTSLNKKERRNFSYCHSLIDRCLRFAAGSSSPMVQLQLLETRWKHMHKQELITKSWRTLTADIEALPDSKK